MNLNLNDIILEPMITEKSTFLASQGKYLFKVHKFANKRMIKTALEKIYGVKVSSCNVVNLKAKRRRTRKRNAFAYVSASRKAIVSLREGSFDFFETLQ